jgi:hypothetical protein
LRQRKATSALASLYWRFHLWKPGPFQVGDHFDMASHDLPGTGSLNSTSRRAWLALAGTTLLGACGGGGGGGDGGGGDGSSLSLTGPDSGAVNVASSSFTVSVSGPVTADIVVTPGSSGGGGVFAPPSVTLTAGAPSATFVYTPATTGTKSIGVTNNQGIANPASLDYSVTGSSGSNPTFAHVASGKGADNVTQQATTSVTLAANRLALLSVVNVATLPNVPTVAGWALVATHVIGDINRVSIFRRLAASPSTQAHVISFGGQSQFFNRWSIEQSDARVNTGGTNGSGAIVQVKRGGAVGLVRDCLLTFDAPFASAAHSTFAVFGGGVTSATPTAGSGFTELARPGVEPFGDRALFVQYKPAADTTADMAWSGGGDVWTGIAVEIAS